MTSQSLAEKKRQQKTNGWFVTVLDHNSQFLNVHSLVLFSNYIFK